MTSLLFSFILLLGGRMKRKMLFFVVVFSFFICSEVKALTLNDLYNDLSSLQRSYADAQKKANMTKQELNNLKASISSTEAEIKNAQNGIVQAENEIKKSEDEITLKKEETDQMLLYLQLMNNNGDSMLEYVMDAESYTDFIYRYAVVSQMSDYNNQVISELNTLVDNLNTKKYELNKQQDELEVKRKELQEKQVLVQTQYQDEHDETMDFADQVAAKKKLIKHYESLGCSRNQNVNTCTGMAAVDGWVYPLNSFYQTSNYGWDENRYHYAVDLAASEGSSVKAVGNGEVIYSGVYWRKDGTSCGGLVIQIRHTYNGVDYISLYMHMLSSGVSVGTKVSAGQVIGTSGGGSQSIAKWKDQCTGGAHLHFTMAYAGKDGGIYNTSSSYQGTTFNPVRFFPALKGIGSKYNWG